MEHNRNFISNNSYSLLTYLLQSNCNKSIVLFGSGQNGKSYIIEKCKNLIHNMNYNIIHEGPMKDNYFEDKHIICVTSIDDLNHIPSNKYVLINMNY